MLAGQPYNLNAFKVLERAGLLGAGGVYPVYVKLERPFKIDAPADHETITRLANAIREKYGVAREVRAGTLRAEYKRWLTEKARESGVALSQPDDYKQLYTSMRSEDRRRWDQHTQAVGVHGDDHVLALTPGGRPVDAAATEAL